MIIIVSALVLAWLLSGVIGYGLVNGKWRREFDEPAPHLWFSLLGLPMLLACIAYTLEHGFGGFSLRWWP